jgi:sec-independent protein translocase protein TatA
MFSNFGFLDLSTPDLIIILVIIIILFGGRKLPELSKSIGESLRELKKGVSGGDNEASKDKEKSPSNKD